MAARCPAVRALHCASVALVVGGLAACAPAGPSPGSTSGAVPAPVTASASVPAAEPLDPLLRSRTAVDNPDGMVVLRGALWVKTDDGRVVRVDIPTHRVTGEVKVDTTTDRSRFCEGIGSDGTAVWACTAGDTGIDVVRVDPVTLARGPVVKVGKVFSQLVLPHTSRGIWVLAGTGSTLSVVDTASGRVTSTDLGVRCTQASASDVLLVASCPDDGVVVVDPSDGTVVRRIPLKGAGVVAVVGRTAWVDTEAGVTELDLDGGASTVFPGVTATNDGDIAVDGRTVWVRGRGGQLWRIDAARRAVVQHLVAGKPWSAGSLLATGGALWATAGDEGLVLRYAP